MKNFKKLLVCSLAAATIVCGTAGIAATKTYAANTPDITGASVTLNEDIVLKFYVKDYAEDYSAKFTFDGKDYTAAVENGVAEFGLVTPQYLDKEVTLTLSKEGEKDVTKKTSVKEYLYSLVGAGKSAFASDSCEKFAKMRTLAVDMLNYGAAAQKKYLTGEYTLVNADLTEAQKAYATTFTAPDDSAKATLSGTKSEEYAWISAGIRFDYNVSLYFVIKPANEGTALRLKVGDKIIENYDVEDGNYKFRYEEVNVVDFAKAYTVNVIDGGDNAIGQTLSYSVNSYVLSKYADESMGDITKAVYNYGVSANAYDTAGNGDHEYAELSLDGAVAYVGEKVDLSNLTLEKICGKCGQKTIVDWADASYVDTAFTEKGEKTIQITADGLTLDAPVTVYERIVTPTKDVIKFSGTDNWTIEFDRQATDDAGYTAGKGLLGQTFVDRVEYVICNETGEEELGTVCLTKDPIASPLSGYISTSDGVYKILLHAQIGNLYATVSGEDIKTRWSNLVAIALGDKYVPGATYSVKARAIAAQNTDFYADSILVAVDNATFFAENVTNLGNVILGKVFKNGKWGNNAFSEADLAGCEGYGAVSLTPVKGSNVQVKLDGPNYTVSNMKKGDNVTFYVYSSKAGKANVYLNLASAAYRNASGGTSGTPTKVLEVVLKDHYSMTFNGSAATIDSGAKATAYSQSTPDWSVCWKFNVTHLATLEVKQGWNEISLTYTGTNAANLGDIALMLTE